MSHYRLRIGIVGLGAASNLVLPAFSTVPDVRLAAGADTRSQACEAFTATYGLPAFESVNAMCDTVEVDAIWIETPNHLHCEQAIAAMSRGKHVICAKPLGVTAAECEAMIAVADRAGVQLLQGHSKIFDTPVRAMREIVESGRIGQVIQIDTWLFNDWLQRPRLSAELDPDVGGGIILRQGPHQVDIVRYLAGAPVRSVRAVTGRWDPNFDAEGNYAALIDFEGNVAATVTLNGYGYFDSTELTWDLGVSGRQTPKGAPARRKRRTGPLTPEEKYGEAGLDAPAFSARAGEGLPFFGLTLVSCERGLIRQSPAGLYLYTEGGCQEIVVPPNLGRAAELIELRDAVAEGRPVFPGGRWGKDTLEVCLAIRDSAQLRREILLQPDSPCLR